MKGDARVGTMTIGEIRLGLDRRGLNSAGTKRLITVSFHFLNFKM